MEKLDIIITILLIMLSFSVGIIMGKIITEHANPLPGSLSHLPAQKYLYDVENSTAQEGEVKDVFKECLNMVRQSDNFQKNLFKKQWLDEGGNSSH